MDADRWQYIRRIFEYCLELNASDQALYLDQLGRDDGETRSEVQGLLDSFANSQAFLETPVLGESLRAFDEISEFANIGKQIGPYRIIRKLGQGGMGTVYLAERVDGYFDKEVAIKLVERAVYRSDLVERFDNERRILASVDHPNIARLLDGGVTESGIPYVVLEYVRGHSLIEHCDTNRLNVQQRLQLFRTICETVHYAHQNLIIHRDLKPSNILVASMEDLHSSGPQIKLLDFGVAKLINVTAETSSDETQLLGNMLTAAYASPEQFKGQPVTTSSDVYSLGVILYELLTGIRPYDISGKSPLEIERTLTFAPILHPSQTFEEGETVHTQTVYERCNVRNASKERLIRMYKGDLNTIVSKALAKDPHERYVSAAQFGDDIGRYLLNLPVIARPVSIPYRISKFIKRHRIGVFVSILVLATLLTSVAVTRYQAQVAENTAGQVRRLANSLLFELNDKIRDLPGATDVRRTLVTHALTYLENLSQETGPDASLQLEIAEAYEQAGRIQGDPHYTNLGDLMGTLGSYQKALSIRESIWKSDSTSMPLRIALANNYARLAVVTSWCCDNDEAIRLSKRAIQVIGPALESDPENLGVRHDKARIQSELGWWLIWDGKSKEGLNLIEKASDELEFLARELPKLVDVQHHLWRSYSYQIDGLKFSGQHEPALLLLTDKAIPYLNQVVERYPNHPLLMYDLHIGYLFLGEMYDALDRFREARESFEESLFIAEYLAQSDSTNRKALEAVAYGSTALGRSLLKSGEQVSAIKHMEKAVSIRVELYNLDPLNAEVGNAAGNAARALCRALMDADELERALKVCNDSADILHAVVSTSFGGPIIEANYASSCAFTARVLKSLSENSPKKALVASYREKALDWYEKALTVLKKVESDNSHLTFEVRYSELEVEMNDLIKSEIK